MYGDPFDLMSGLDFSMLFNAALRDKAGIMPAKEKIVITSTSTNNTDVRLMPYHQMGPGTRAAVIEIDGRLPSPLIDIPYRAYADPQPTAKIDLYVEYRRAQSYDENLKSEKLVENTKGLLIHLSLNEIDMKIPHSYQLPNGKSHEYDEVWEEYDKNYFSIRSWLLDMTPHDGRATVTLNRGAKFYHDEWGITIQNIRPDGDEGITFDVEYGKKPGIGSDVYRTAFFSGDYTNLLNRRPLLYSDKLDYRLEYEVGELVIKQKADDQIVWRGIDQGIPKRPFFDKMEFKDGNLILSAAGKAIWSSNTEGHPGATFIINEYGKPNIVDKNGVILWSEKSMILNCSNSPTGAKVTLLSNDGEKLKFQMDWNEGSGFNKNSLKITNGECVNCPNLGGSAARQAVYEIKPTNLLQPMFVRWSNTRYCGEGSLKLINNVLPCEDSPAGSKITYIKNDGFGVQIQMDWEEDRPFDGNSLKIDNGECVYCPQVEDKKATYLIQPTDLSEPVTVRWADTDYCGNGSFTLPSTALLCTNSPAGSKASLVSNYCGVDELIIPEPITPK
jgi:hypothetical protein